MSNSAGCEKEQLVLASEISKNSIISIRLKVVLL